MSRGKNREPRHEGVDPPRLPASIRVPTASEVELLETFEARPIYVSETIVHRDLVAYLNNRAAFGYRLAHLESDRVSIDRQWVEGYRVLLERR